jgi:hypothetical protein
LRFAGIGWSTAAMTLLLYITASLSVLLGLRCLGLRLRHFREIAIKGTQRGCPPFFETSPGQDLLEVLKRFPPFPNAPGTAADGARRTSPGHRVRAYSEKPARGRDTAKRSEPLRLLTAFCFLGAGAGAFILTSWWPLLVCLVWLVCFSLFNYRFLFSDPQKRDARGWTDLHWSAALGLEGRAKRLITKGADIEAKDHELLTPLHRACFAGQEDLVALLISKGANLAARDKELSTPLHVASFKGHGSVVELLLAAGADVGATEKVGWTPLHCAASQGHRNVAEILIAGGANVKAVDSRFRTPLHEAALQGHEDVVMLLLDRGADPDAKDKWGGSVLDFAATTPLTKTRKKMGHH